MALLVSCLYTAADYVINIESIPHLNVATAKHTIATKRERERGKKCYMGHEEIITSVLVCFI